ANNRPPVPPDWITSAPEKEQILELPAHPAAAHREDRSHRLVIAGGFITFGWVLLTALLWSLAAGFIGHCAGTLVGILAGICAVGNFALSIVVFLGALRLVFAQREWTGTASLVSACLSFLANCFFGALLLASLSTYIMGERLKDALSPSKTGAPAKKGLFDR